MTDATHFAPKIDTIPTTPSGEWAAETSEALGSRSNLNTGVVTSSPSYVQHPGTTATPDATLAKAYAQPEAPTLESVASTPGHELPGAFPKESATGVIDQAKQYLPAQEDVRSAAATVGQQAYESLPTQEQVQSAATTAAQTAQTAAVTAAQTAQSALATAAETAKAYLPASVVGYIPGSSNDSTETPTPVTTTAVTDATSLPSQEINGAQPYERSSGAGALPGSNSEAGVARLPDDKATTTAVTDATSLPSQEVAGAQPYEHSSGVGALPGTAFESGIARLPDENASSTNPVAAARGAATNAAQKAQDYLPTQDGLQSALTNAGQTAKSYLPDALIPGAVIGAAGTAAATTSLPSSERTGAQPGEHTDGVGALPGRSTETGVAKLPDERAGTNTATLPSQEPMGFQPGHHTGGVGALPGKSTETGVATLPDERGTNASTLPSQESSGIQPGETTAGVGALPGAADEEGVARLPDERADGTDSKLKPRLGLATEREPHLREARDKLSSKMNGSHETSAGVVTSSDSQKQRASPGGGVSLESDKSFSPPPASLGQPVIAAPNRNTAQPVVYTQAREHALGGIGAQWRGQSLEQPNDSSSLAQLSREDSSDDEGGGKIWQDHTRAPGLLQNGKAAEGQEVGEPCDPDQDKNDKKNNRDAHGHHHPQAGSTTAETGHGSEKADGPTTTKDHNPADIVTGNDHAKSATTMSTSSNDTSSSPTKSKPKFMDKIKGEAKIIVGKLGNKESKVEEGKKLKSGETY